MESLLAQPASGRGFLDGPAVAAAAQMVSDIGASVLTGKRLGTYQVQARIGAGGMGEVYRARDTKLGRDVAIKILPRHFAQRSRTAGAGSSAKRACSPRSIIRTSARSTGSKTRTGFARSCWSWSRARRWPTASRAARSPFDDALTHRAPDRRCARGGAREGHRAPRPEAGQHQDHARRRREGARLRSGEGGGWRRGDRGSDAVADGDVGGTRRA